MQPSQHALLTLSQPIAVMAEEGTDVSAFESFTIEDAGGQKEAKEGSGQEAGWSNEVAVEVFIS